MPKINLILRSMAAIVTVAVLAGLTIGAKSNQSPNTYLVKISRDVYKAHLQFMRENDFDLTGVDIKANLAYLMVDQAGKAKLAGLNPTLIQDIQLVSKDGPDAKFKTSQQIAEQLTQLASQYPTLAAVSAIGKSLDGRDIMAMKITQNVHGDAGQKPAILFNGMHHAREVMSSEVPLDIAEYLLSNYGNDPQVTHWVNSNVIYVLPMLNVDGNNHIWNDDTMWRKNNRGGFGVDINRNYPYAWNSCNGSSSQEMAQDYRGPAAASEPETNVMMDFVAKIHPVFSISFHSYSELVIYPYGCGGHTETKEVVEPIGIKMAELTITDDAQGHYTAGTAPELLYSVDGSDIDWMYHEHKVIPYVMEVNSAQQGFQPAFDAWRSGTVARLRPAWQYLLTRLDGPSISGRANPNSGKILIKGLHGYSETYPVHADGSYFIVVNPGTYFLTTEGHAQAQKIVVGNRSLRLNLN